MRNKQKKNNNKKQKQKIQPPPPAKKENKTNQTTKKNNNNNKKKTNKNKTKTKTNRKIAFIIYIMHCLKDCKKVVDFDALRCLLQAYKYILFFFLFVRFSFLLHLNNL